MMADGSNIVSLLTVYVFQGRLLTERGYTLRALSDAYQRLSGSPYRQGQVLTSRSVLLGEIPAFDLLPE